MPGLFLGLTAGEPPMSEETPPPTPPVDPTPNPVPYETPPAAKSGPPASAGPPPDKDAITMGMLCHLLGIFTGFLGPLIIWLIKKDTSPFVDDQGKESLNFQIVALIACLICIPLNFVFCLGAILMLAIQVARIVFGILATIQANKGVAYRYPVTFRLIK
jgi:uncharacterized Tic20 family protein